MDFNFIFIDEIVGDLFVMGLFDDWDDLVRVNDQVLFFDEDWGFYLKCFVCGVNLGGWLFFELFIILFLFNYDVKDGVIDEWNFCQKFGVFKLKIFE